MRPSKASTEDRLRWFIKGLPGVGRVALTGLAGFLVAL